MPHEATIDDYWKKMEIDRSLSERWIGVTRSDLLKKKNSPEKKVVGSMQIDEEKGHNKTRNHLATRMMSNMSKVFTA